jgi:thiol:disulfide interchange protein
MTNNPYKPLWGLFAILVVVAGVTVFSKATARKDNVPWRTDVAAAGLEAKQVGKPALLYFTASWCGPCQQMRSATWGDPSVDAKLRSSYVPVKVDIDSNRETALAYEIDAVPTMVLLDADGKVARRTTGFLEADEFLAWLGGAGGS